MTTKLTGKTPDGTAYQVCGNGDAVVLIHGVGLDQSIWNAQVQGLAQHYQVITYDMLGHGHSPLPPKVASLDDYAGQLQRLLQHLDCGPVHLIGFSMGGLVARVFAIQQPQLLRSLVIMGSVFDRTEDARQAILARTLDVARHGPEANIDAALERWFSPEYRAANTAGIQGIRDLVCANNPEGYLRAYRLFAGSDNYLADRLIDIRVPTLVMAGELDPGSTPEMAQKLACQIPSARCQIMAGQRHMMAMESPQLINHALQLFLGSCNSTCPATSSETCL
ncbi:alpha/beta fold hydrolase [Oceanobacter sp. 4_MG-2023]|jgi:pimeloyl-ACP methyl ester carboxylesterase|uniref:alpha/beta fold hydrolase n=1 Tax=Oceanobacter sp. 4_MG-2023 TaxID=3062623 RepID=UPI00273379AC|nr:alpha/beta fold hydrolase [Oceanobacter sp. 4_MG-2023]MDP2548358.1 alpha/beta fold hydrolase [Oceanobacter sp. 4_MG-2023]